MSDWLADVRFVLRGWRRTPGFSATIVLTLVLGLGLASAIFAFADGYLFRPWSFPGANQLYYVEELNRSISLTDAMRSSDQLALQQSTIGNFGFVRWGHDDAIAGAILDGDRRVAFHSYAVSPGFRRTVQLPLFAGRDFIDADHVRGGLLPAWLTYRFWRRSFGGDTAVLGRTYRVEGARGFSGTMQVVGIVGPEVSSFNLSSEPEDVIVPDATLPAWTMPIVRLPDGVTREQGETQIARVLQAIAPAPDGSPRRVSLRSLHEDHVAGGRPTARVLFAGAMLVLLLAAINLVHLLLARGVSRAGEIATRAALGGSRWRLTRLFLTESLLLGAIGIAGGLMLGSWLAAVIEASIPRWPTNGRNMALVAVHFDWRVVAFAVGLGVTAALIGGLWPAWRALRRPLAWGNRQIVGVTASVPARLSRLVLASELTVATIVMVGTLFIGLGIWRYLHQPLGFDAADRFQVTLLATQFRRLIPTEVDGALQSLGQIAQVRAVAPFRPSSIRGVEVPGRALDPKLARAAGVRRDFFEAWNLRVRAGRWFTTRELAGDEPVAVVDEKFARLAWPKVDSVGQEVRVGRGALRRVVGVIEPLRESLSQEAPAKVYIPAPTQPLPYFEETFVIWAPGASLSHVQSAVVAAIRAWLPGVEALPVRPLTMETLFGHEIGEAQFQAPIVAAFGVLAFVLAGIGVFGLVSYLVEQRTREFGIRLALGARPRDIWRNVIRQSVNPALVGLVIGIAGAWALESIVRSSVFGWESSGAGAALVVAVALIAVAVVAAMVPARRAMRIDPAVTLRME